MTKVDIDAEMVNRALSLVRVGKMLPVVARLCLLALSTSVIFSSAGNIHVEVKLVADKTMFDFYGDRLQSYIVELFYSTQSHFEEGKLGFPVNIALANIEIMKENPKDLDIQSFDLTYELKLAFDEYISRNKKPSEHFDTAILLTRHRMNNVQANGFLCGPSSNGVIRDEGFASAVELASLIAATFGMPQDETSKNMKCQAASTIGSIMGQHWALSHTEVPKYFWTDCSLEFVKKWIDRVDRMPCIRDQPKIDASPIFEAEPGHLINPIEQCRSSYGNDFEAVLSASLKRPDICQALRCIRRDKTWPHTVVESHDRRMSALEGSLCANNKVCNSGACVNDDKKTTKKVEIASNPRWRIGKWADCCGEATKTRTIKCAKGNKDLPDSECEKYLSKPRSVEKCQLADVAFCTKDLESDTTPDRSGCPVGWTREGKFCYRGWPRNGNIDGYMTDLFCQARGGLTAQIMNQKQNDVVLRMLNTGSKSPDDKKLAHIGVRWTVPGPNGAVWGALQWLDGTQVYSDERR
ncbi:A disintegrin and metalloproteinase with thrombospondin motifs 8-like isoform X2 [Tubulanus polymorphus]